MTNHQQKKILIVISGDLFIRNYLTTDAFSAIEKHFECYYVGAESISMRSEIASKNNFYKFYHFDNEIKAAHYRIFNVLMWRHRKKSSSFMFRIMRQTQIKFRKCDGIYNILLESLKLPFRLIRSWKVKLPWIIFGSDLIFPLYKKYVIETIPINQSILDAVRHIKPDAVVFPSSAYDPEGNDVARICNQLRIPSLFLIDNWDNLSSKSIMWAKPSYVGVWGRQSAEHAVDIQGLPPDRITPIGTPRFDQYFQLRDKELPSRFEHKYILFVGTAMAFNEAEALKILSLFLEKNRDHFSDVKVVYRPHPWRQGNDSILTENLKHVIIDPQLYDSYSNRRSNIKTQPDLTYYPALLKNAEFVIGGLTSMLIESLIFGKRFLALVYDDKVNITSQHNALKYYVHFRGLEGVSGIQMCRDIENLPRDFSNCWRARNDLNIHEIDRLREYFLHEGTLPYKNRLRALLEKITSQGVFP